MQLAPSPWQLYPVGFFTSSGPPYHQNPLCPQRTVSPSPLHHHSPTAPPKGYVVSLQSLPLVQEDLPMPLPLGAGPGCLFTT